MITCVDYTTFLTIRKIDVTILDARHYPIVELDWSVAFSSSILWSQSKNLIKGCQWLSLRRKASRYTDILCRHNEGGGRTGSGDGDRAAVSGGNCPVAVKLVGWRRRSCGKGNLCASFCFYRACWKGTTSYGCTGYWVCIRSRFWRTRFPSYWNWIKIKCSTIGTDSNIRVITVNY